MEEHKIVKTDTLKVNVFHMPVISLAVRFCYCFVEPIPMIWQNDGQISVALTQSQSGNDIMAKFFLNKYREVIENSKRQGLWDDSLAWLEEVDKVNMITCDLTPKNEFNWQEFIKKG